MNDTKHPLLQPINEGPHGWVQWKGTSVCIDLYCECGHHGHYDGWFLYYWECSQCHKIWEVCGTVLLCEPSPREAVEHAKTDNGSDFMGDNDDEIKVCHRKNMRAQIECAKRLVAQLERELSEFEKETP